MFRSVVESVKDYAIFMLDLKGRVTSWNSGAEQIKGYKAEEIIGQHFSRFYTPEDLRRGKPEEELRMAIEQGHVEDEGWRVRKDGSRFWADVVISAIRDSDGELAGFSKVTRDFTDRKRAEEALLLQLSGALLSNVDVRKLLSAISASVQNVVPHDVGILGLYDAETNQLRVQLLETGDSPKTVETVVPIANSPPGWAFDAREPLVVDDLKLTSFAPETYSHLTEMLGSRDHAIVMRIITLHAGDEGNCQTTTKKRIFALGLLSMSPAWIAKDVDIRRPEI